MRSNTTTTAETADLYEPIGQAERRRLLPTVVDGIAGAWRAYMTRRAQLATLRVLEVMDDRMLKDIGITRGEIPSVVYDETGDRARRFEKTWE